MVYYIYCGFLGIIPKKILILVYRSSYKMKVLRKILYAIAGLLVLLTILIVVCAYNPALTEKIQGLIFRGRAVEVRDVEVQEGEKTEETEMTGEAEAAEAPVGEQKMRTLEEAGISEDSLIKDIDTYYKNCHDQIVEHGLGDYSFENVVASETLVQEVYASYSNKDYASAYMDEALTEIGAYSYDMNLLVEELEGKNYRLTHQISIN